MVKLLLQMILNILSADDEDRVLIAQSSPDIDTRVIKLQMNHCALVLRVISQWLSQTELNIWMLLQIKY